MARLISKPEGKPGIRFLVDWGGPACFLAAYLVARFGPPGQDHNAAMLTGTWALVAGSVVALSIGYAAERRIAPIPLLAALMGLIFGALTLITHDPRFLYVKPTVINVGLGAVMLGGVWLRKNPLKALFNGAVQMSEPAWRRITVRYGIFFLFVAGLNEVVWRTNPELWPYFRMPGLLIVTVLFSVSQVPAILREMKALEAAAELEG